MTRFDFILRVLLAAVIAPSVCAGTASADDRRDNAQMGKLVRPVLSVVKNSVVRVLSGDRPVALGTVVSADGFVLTKRSELTVDRIRVQLADGRLYSASVAAVRRQNDLALLRIEEGVSLTPAKFSNVAPPVASFLISAGRTDRPVGIGIVGVKARRVDHRGRLGVMLKPDSSGRAVVDQVFVGSGADHAGIAPGDLIVAINGRTESTREGVIETLRGMYPGESVRLTILRPDESRNLETMEMDANIREFGVMQETESDSKVNGPRSARLSGFDQVIQHDTVLDPEDCGGPVLDTSGNVIGVNIARAGRVVSYSLPSSLVLPLMVSMLEEARSRAN